MAIDHVTLAARRTTCSRAVEFKTLNQQRTERTARRREGTAPTAVSLQNSQ